MVAKLVVEGHVTANVRYDFMAERHSHSALRDVFRIIPPMINLRHAANH